ncbi:MAG TPA: c-type cytochrome [Candidatus Acidoferrum sp.]|jgi:hypothetical protein
MKTNPQSILCVMAILLAVVFLVTVERLAAQAKPTADAAPTAEKKFKNIQVLKDIPADQLIPSMQFIAASLGVECEFCHVEHAMDKDDKKTKMAARKMITMMMAINKTNFEGEREVTCYTCHRGAAHPVGTPILSTENPLALPTPHMHEDEEAQPSLPTAQAILQKYLSAVGGADALHKIKTRVQKGNIEAFGEKYPIDIYSEGPDKRISISHPSSGASVTAFNGQTGWLAMPRGFHKMTEAEQQAAGIDAQLYFAARFPELYPEFHVHPGAVIDGKPTYLVSAKGKDLPSLDLYFDQGSGLLMRLIRYAETPLGRNPTEIDYTDFRLNDGVKIPYRWTLARPNGRFTIQVDDVKQNIPIDERLFVMPTGQDSH